MALKNDQNQASKEEDVLPVAAPGHSRQVWQGVVSRQTPAFSSHEPDNRYKWPRGNPGDKRQSQRAGPLSKSRAHPEHRQFYTATPSATTSPTSPPPEGPNSRVGVLFLQTGPDEHLVTGAGDASITFTSDRPGPPITGILSTDELFYQNGTRTPRRRLNGDENSQGQSLRIYATDLAQGRIYKLHLYRYR